VVFFSASFPPVRCGIGDYMARLAAGVAKLPEHDVTVFTTTAAAPADDSVTVLPLFESWSVPEFLRRYPRVLRSRPGMVIGAYPAVVPTPSTSLLFFLPVLARLLLPRCRIVLIVHEFARTEPAARRLLKITLRFAHEVIVLNPLDNAALANEVPAVARRLRTIPIGSNIRARGVPRECLVALRESVGAPESVVLHFGFLQAEEKGFEDLLEAIRLMHRGAVVCASGSLDDRAYHEILRRRIAETGVAVNWLGHLSERDAAAWLQAADAVVLPFHQGVTANRTTVLAALINGAVVITTRGPGTPEYLRDGENVLLVPPTDSQALVGAIDRCLASEELRTRLRRGAAALAPRFEWSRIACEIVGTKERT
jgi:glycosyltransferase involved in cell wall biosynthesis